MMILFNEANYKRLLNAMILLLVATLCQAGQDNDLSKVKPSDSRAEHDRLPFANKASGGWHGKRQWLKQTGISIDARIVPEGFVNFRGGRSSSEAISAITSILALDIDTEKLISLTGGELMVNLTNHAGENPSAKLTGDLQVFDNLNARPYLQIFELWYQQTLFAGQLRLKAGKVDANTCFSVIDNGLPFLNSSTQVSPALFLFPTTPDPMPSVNAFFNPRKQCFLNFGVYYANRSMGFGNFEGRPQNVQPTQYGAFLIGETGLLWQHDPVLAFDGNLKIGFWGHTGKFTRLDSATQNGTHGYYFIFNQTLRRPGNNTGDNCGLRTFLSFGRTQSTINAIDWNINWGISWTGIFASRPDDIVGFSPNYAHITQKAGLPKSYELAIEAFYRLQVAGWAKIMPDLQYIVNPGGRYPDALVGTLRVIVDL